MIFIPLNHSPKSEQRVLAYYSFILYELLAWLNDDHCANDSNYSGSQSANGNNDSSLLVLIMIVLTVGIPAMSSGLPMAVMD